MRYNVSDEISKKLVELEIANRELMLTMYDAIEETLKKFDGKIFSKRIETALKKNVSENIRVKREFNSVIIEFYFENRMVEYNNSIAYLKNSYEYFAHMTAYSEQYPHILDNEKLVYSEVLKELEKTKEYLKESVDKMKTALTEINNILTEYEELREKCREFNSKTNWAITEYYGIKYFSET